VGKICLNDVLLEENVTEVFHPTYRQPLGNGSRGISHYALTHEQAVIHAADGYSRSTGKVGVAFITSEFGLANAVTGLNSAQIDSIPLLIFVGHETSHIDRELDVMSMLNMVVKHHYTVHSIESLLQVTRCGLQLAGEGRPGVVIIECHTHLLQAEGERSHMISHGDDELAKKRRVTDPGIEKVLTMLSQAEKSVIIVGGGH
jgi:acetolactate synthase-1/2/3 large subunit